MKKYSRKHFKNIQKIVQSRTGVELAPERSKINRMVVLAGCLMCFVMLSAFAYTRFSDLNGDKVGFALAYQGEGRFEIVVVNSSDRELVLQDDVKLMRWSSGEAVKGDRKKIKIAGRTIAPHSQGIVSIDISEGYDVKAMEKDLRDGDWYYFVLTNNHFAFGQDWMCSFDFEMRNTETAEESLYRVMERSGEEKEETGRQYDASALREPAWSWPTVSRQISASYGVQENGTYSDHINIAGEEGDEIYAVADGIVTKTAFEGGEGNVIVLRLENDVMVRYGHLKDIQVSEGEEVAQGQVIAALGQTGTATGPNLSFEVSVNGEAVDPLAAQ